MIKTDRGGGAGRVVRNNGRHFGPDAFGLIWRQGPEITPGNGNAGDDIGFSLGRCAHAIGIKCGLLPAGDQAHVEGQIWFGQFCTKARQDARHFKNRAVTDIGTENARAMTGLGLGGQQPAIGGPARDGAHVASGIADQPFEIQGNVRPLARGDQIGPGCRLRLARILFIASHMDFDIGARQRAGGLHGTQRRNNGHKAPLVIAGARPFVFIDTRPGATNKCLKRRIFFKNGIKMGDQQQALAILAARARGNQMPGPAGCAHILPDNLKAQRLQLGAHHAGHGFDAVQIK